MSDRGWMEPIVERIVGQVLDSHVTQARDEIVRMVLEELANQPASGGTSNSTSADLARAFGDIRTCTSQKEILRSLLDASSRYAARVALFVVKPGSASGWQARGFANDNGFKDFALEIGSPAVHRAITERVSGRISIGEFDARFLEEFGGPAGEAQLLPLILKDKVAALVYADGGSEGAPLDAGSLEVLVLASSASLEINALRKQAHPDATQAAHDAASAGSHQKNAAAPAYNDPFAAHSPAFAMAAAASAGASESAISHAPDSFGTAQAVAVEVQSAAEAVHAVAPHAVASDVAFVEQAQASVPADEQPAAGVSHEELEVHRKAQRFARLLVDEIKLYNQAKVSEGRKKKDLYDRLKDTIEKSRTTYQKRYGTTVAASANYFQHEVVRSLAEDDVSVMGPNF